MEPMSGDPHLGLRLRFVTESVSSRGMLFLLLLLQKVGLCITNFRQPQMVNAGK